MKIVKYICYYCDYECCEGDFISSVKEILHGLSKYLHRLTCPFCGGNYFLDMQRSAKSA